jgi:hypothetical protein
MNEFHQRKDLADLVALKMANEVPARRRRKQWNLGDQLLRTAFTKYKLAYIKGLAH